MGHTYILGDLDSQYILSDMGHTYMLDHRRRILQSCVRVSLSQVLGEPEHPRLLSWFGVH